ncbi:uncharacterized protein [Acropora muricata]|uniref:uncharacterized protein n=1 Tax=Acropora muricata TaxID=159855 RepID=UPI0034E57E2E
MQKLKRCKQTDKKSPKEAVARNSPHQDHRITEPENTMQGGILVSVIDLQKAERLMIKAVQSEEFSNEIERLQTLQRKDKAKGRTAKQVTKGSSPIHRLDPVLDDNGILRVGGRIQQADVPYDVKHPILLPKRSHVTDLVIRYYHQQSAHQGRARTHAEIRASGFWIISGSSMVGHHVIKCVTCRKLRGAPQQQKMSDLPADRTEQAPPFTYSAVDYFGPWYIKEGRKEMKRYGVLFTCMYSRAVHLETAASLSTDSFLNAYRRFVGRRGPVRQLRSDQGTNFVGAKNELEATLLEMNHTTIQRELLKQNCDWIDWKMNVPQASHMGGAWERQIRTVRSVLSALLQKHGRQLDDESLRTLMVETEAIVNSRPLSTDDLADPSSVGALTPNHLLTMKSSVVLAPPGNFQAADVYSRKRWRRVQPLADEFGHRWKGSFLQSLQSRQKWTAPKRNLEVGDVVILKDVDIPRNCWKLARVTEVHPDQDGYVRKVTVVVADRSLDANGRRKQSMTSQLSRPIHKVVLLMSSSEKKDREIAAKEP